MVTVGAVISALIAISSVVGYAAGVEVTRIGSDGIEQGEQPAPILSVIAVVAPDGDDGLRACGGRATGRCSASRRCW